MATQYEEYKFPHEQEETKDELDITIEGDDEPDVKVKVVDDTPEEDRNKDPLPSEIKSELERLDESQEYTAGVTQEALKMTQRILDENNRLKGMLQSGEKELISTYQTSAEMELDKAERNYKEAYDSGDSDKLLAAQKELVRAEMKLDKAKNFKPTVQIPENEVQTVPSRQEAEPQMDPKVASWVSKNPWFVDRDKRAMRKFAEGVHEDLAERYGKGYIGTDEYFNSIDKEVKKRFPEEFASSSTNDEGKPQRTRPSTVVAPAKRSTASKQVVLTKTEVGLAKNLGLTNEQYAREKMKLEA